MASFYIKRKRRVIIGEDFDTIPLTSVKNGEGYKLELKSSELRELYNHLGTLYDLHLAAGVPKGRKKFIQVTPQLEALSSLSYSEIQKLLDANTELGDSLFTKLLDWACTSKDTQGIINNLSEISSKSFASLNAAVGLNKLKRALKIWEANIENTDEEFWQKTLAENSFLLDHLYTWPTTIVKGKAYVGGKNVFNKGANLVDFLVKNKITKNAALIEIKTPSTDLIGSPYRQTYNVSSELSGSVMQVLNYKHSLQESYFELTRGEENPFESFNPQCAVIIGNLKQGRMDRNKVKAFELYRSQFKEVNVFTFDELFGKTKALIEILENPCKEINVDRTYEFDIPF